jgi:uncharacterized protein (TIGR03435 family)
MIQGFAGVVLHGRVLHVALMCAMVTAGVGVLVAQGIDMTLAATPFAAASVKKNRSGTNTTDGAIGGGRFRYVNETVVRLIGEAHGAGQPLPAFKIVGGPDWITSERYDVNAVADGNPTRDELHASGRRLLAERFHLRAHGEQRDLPIYELVLDRRDGKLGPQLRHSETQCAYPGRRLWGSRPRRRRSQERRPQGSRVSHPHAGCCSVVECSAQRE